MIGRVRTWIIGILIAIGAQCLLVHDLGRVDHVVFDEEHYIPAARHLLMMDAPANIEHPPLGKEIIAAGILLTQDDPHGWRLGSAICGMIAVMGAYTLMMILYGSVATATTAALLALLNGMVYVQARTAMLDMPLTAFVIWGIVFASLCAKGRWPWRSAIAAGTSFGLAAACKWMAAPYIAATCIGLILLRQRDRWLSAHRRIEGDPERLHMAGRSPSGLALLIGAVSVVVYLQTYLPFFLYQRNPLGGIGDLLDLQMQMLDLQMKKVPPHPYQSEWWAWPFDIRPLWFLFEEHEGGQRAILLLSNPLSAMPGLVCVAVCLIRWRRERDPRHAFVTGLWLLSWGMFAIIPKAVGFAYYYVPASLMLAMVTAAALHRRDGRGWRLQVPMLLIAAAGFWTFHPIYSGERMPMGQWESYMWTDRWR